MKGGRGKRNGKKRKEEYSTFYSNVRIVSFRRKEERISKKKGRKHLFQNYRRG